jgi:hypothetical protein
MKYMVGFLIARVFKGDGARVFCGPNEKEKSGWRLGVKKHAVINASVPEQSLRQSESVDG